MRSVISDMGDAILERAPNLGCYELRNAIRIYLAQSKGIIAETDQIIIGSGAEYLYSLIAQLLGKGFLSKPQLFPVICYLSSYAHCFSS